MRMVLVIVLALFLTMIMVTLAKADVGDANKPHSVIMTKIPGEIRIMVIDTGIGQNKRLSPWVQRVKDDDNYVDSYRNHGTHVTGIIIYGNDIHNFITNENSFKDKVCKKVKIFSCKYFSTSNGLPTNLQRTVACVNRAVTEKMDVVNYSDGGTEPNPDEYQAFSNFVNTGGIVYAAAGNEHSDLAVNPYYPASYSMFPTKMPEQFNENKELVKFYKTMIPLKNFFVVSALDWNGNLIPSSNYYDDKTYEETGDLVYSTLPDNKFGFMSGTSQATPELLHKELLIKCGEVF